ncbi:hypothetical protein K501DRAFT_175556, partial [Backusella circina FSU 941]
YLAYLSSIALEFRQTIVLTDHVKDGIDYKNTFDGKEAVDKIALIVKTSDRKLALRIGKSLSEQRFFHDVSYETKLVDSEFYFYEFSNRSLYINSNDTASSSLLDQVVTTRATLVGEEDLHIKNTEQYNIKTHHQIVPAGIITEMTRCYSPTCLVLRPCYSPTCPKRLLQFKKHHSSDSFASTMIQRHFKKTNQDNSINNHDLWADNISRHLYNAITKIERKRQENIYELIYTEEDYVNSLQYLQTMWITPLLSESIIPQVHREEFVKKVFGGISSIHNINKKLLVGLLKRQKEYPIVYQIGDVLLRFVSKFLPYISYGAKQYEAKILLENEMFTNPNFDLHPNSLKLELNGYLTKPTTRLGRYTLLFKEILKHTPPDHPDQQSLTKAIEIIKQLLSNVNLEAGHAKNVFDLMRINQNLTFKLKSDQVNLNLLSSDRLIVKQGLWKKAPQADSVEYQVVLLDNYLVVAKIKISNGVERFVIQKKPIPIELLSIQLPDLLVSSKRSSTRLLYSTPTVSTAPISRAATDLGPHTSDSHLGNNNKTTFFPLTFQYLGGHNESRLFTLFTSSFLIRKQWIEEIRDRQAEKDKKNPIFQLSPVLGSHLLSRDIRLSYFITFGGGLQYLFSSNDGIYVGHHNCKTDRAKSPQKILDIYNVTQIEVIEKTQTLLVLADRVLWEYPLEVVNGTPKTQSPGYRLQSSVPFFHVGTSNQRTLLCIPHISKLRSIISVYEPRKKIEHQFNLKKHKNIFEQLLLHTGKQKQSSEHKSFKKLKDFYVPYEAHRVELTPSMILITTSRGIIMIDMRTDQPQQLLNPNDPSLEFLLEKEREQAALNLRQLVKRISIFKTPQNHHFLCYDGYGLFIDRKGNRLFPDFLIEWEGMPESFAFSYPYVLAFDPSFIEVRNIHTGTIEQIIRGKNLRCLNNGHKTELPLAFATMADPVIDNCQFLFSLNLIPREDE